MATQRDGGNAHDHETADRCASGNEPRLGHERGAARANEYGAARLLGALFQTDVDYAWLGDTTWTLVVAAIHAWKWMGLSMLIYLAGLKTIPDDIIEAARIDGASRMRIFWTVKWPLLAPAATFSVASSLLGSMNGFEAVTIGVPLWLVVATASKSRGEALNPNLTLPTDWQLLDNLREVWRDGEVAAAFFGSLLIVIPAVTGALIVGSMASWILARRSTRLSAVLYALAISGIVLPPAVVTVVLLLRQLGLAGTAVGMIGVYMGIYMSTVIFFYAFFVIGGRIDTLPLNLFHVASAGLYLNN
ncbi:ABC transporter permease subunit [Actinomadura rudentiformis]|uniref:ABC transporter permease subunit n=1 Tax=Actinomadura rudentiformis TaxID=359158 RepID=UPI00178C5488|nr:ABC transporter permease subunit [Actinomadura rudentiformis]